MLFYWPALAIGKVFRFVIRLVRKGGGSALPGLIFSKIAPGVLWKVLSGFPQGLVVVTGSAGKSTTTKMLVAILRAHGLEVFTNPSTANILQGFYSTIIEKSSFGGRIRADVAVLEMDEAHAEQLSRKVSPNQVTILNVLEDQLDRFVDPALVREDLATLASRTTNSVLLNADDQNTILIGNSVSANRVSWFGIEPKIIEAEDGLQTAPTYLPELDRPTPNSEVVSYGSRVARIRAESREIEVTLPSRGLHFALDAVAAFESARVFLASNFDSAVAEAALNEVPPVFARGEMVQINGEDVEFILVQNPGSMQLNLNNLDSDPEQILFGIGRDVHDPSWLWTVDYKNLSHVDVCTGFNAYEAALLLLYNDVPVEYITDDLENAIKRFFDLPKPARGHKTVIFSADVMRRMRRALGFWSPEEVER